MYSSHTIDSVTCLRLSSRCTAVQSGSVCRRWPRRVPGPAPALANSRTSSTRSLPWSANGQVSPAASNRRIVNRTVEGAVPIRRAISRVDIPADFNLITSRTWRIASLSVGIQVPLRKAERRDRIGARRGRVTRATSNRNGGRDHSGTVGDIERNQHQYVWRFLRSHKIDLAARKSWCESNDPNFTAKAADVVGLYVAPPEKAIVLCVDEKPSLQSLERAQGYLKLPNGRALTGQSHDYKRHGTTTLFATLEVATGKIIATHSKRRRRVEFLDFMNSVTAAFPNQKLHVILDNLNTHKKNEQWLKAHPNVQFHFTPTSASWLNQVEVWFSILQGQSLSGASFTSLKQLQQHIDAYIDAYNEKAEPFVWTKKKVRQRRFKGRRITQL